MNVKSFIRLNSLVFFFILAYSISWTGIFLALGPGGFQIFSGEKVLSQGLSAQLIFIWVSMLAGPTIACLLLTSLVDGKEGLKKLFLSIIHWKVHIKWYAAALLLIPAVLVTTLYALSFISPKFSPNFSLGMGMAIGLIGGFFEEVGWTGFALPRLQSKFTPFVSAIILGFIHTIWHFMADYLGGIAFYKEIYFLHFLLWIIALIAFRILAVWIYNQTHSLLLATLTHSGFTGSQLVFGPIVTGEETIVWYSVFMVALCTIAAIIILKNKRMFLHKSIV
jgi:membrane protease YdiL (CAAX protease family)